MVTLSALDIQHGSNAIIAIPGAECGNTEAKAAKAAEAKAAAADATDSDTEAIVKQSKELAEGLGLPTDRVEKDLTLFGSNSERMDQAVELVEETIAAEKRKKERRLADQAQRTSS